MDVMQKFKNEFFEERKDLLSKNHVYRNHITKFVKYLNLPDVQLSNAPARININTVKNASDIIMMKENLIPDQPWSRILSRLKASTTT